MHRRSLNLGNASTILGVTPSAAALDLLDEATFALMRAKLGVSGSLFTQTDNVTITNSGTETTLVGTGVGSLLLPAGWWTVGRSVIAELCGVFSVDATVPSLNFRLKHGSTTLSTTGDNTPELGAVTNVFWHTWFFATCRTVGASGTIFTQGYAEFDSTTAGVFVRCAAATAAVTVDTTAQASLNLTADFGSTTSGDTITCTNLTVIDHPPPVT